MPATPHEILLPGGLLATIDAADWDRETSVGFSDGAVWRGRICDVHWRAVRNKHTTYAVACVSVAGHRRELRLHRAVAGAGANIEVDHRNHNGLDNRRENLRVVSSGGNAMNRGPTIGRRLPKGVALHRASGRFEAYIRHRRRKYHLGLFATAEEASAAYDHAAKSLFGEFACPNGKPT